MNYAIIKNGIVINLILWDGEVDIGLADDEQAVLVPEGVIAYIGYGYKDGVFESPSIPSEDVIEANTRLKATLMSQATDMINVLTDATDPDIMGDDINPEDVTNLKLWKAYRVQLSRITDMLNPVWPKQPNA